MAAAKICGRCGTRVSREPIAPADPTKKARPRRASDASSMTPDQRIVTGAGSGGTVVGCAPATGASWACEAGPGAAAAGPPGGGAADAVAVLGGGPPGITTT